jgi:antitoxin component of MazEF toxin-antitoxin module
MDGSRICDELHSPNLSDSSGIIIPKAISEQCQFEDDVEMEVGDGTLIIRPIFKRRVGWKDAFKRVKKKTKTAPCLNGKA